MNHIVQPTRRYASHTMFGTRHAYGDAVLLLHHHGMMQARHIPCPCFFNDKLVSNSIGHLESVVRTGQSSNWYAARAAAGPNLQCLSAAGSQADRVLHNCLLAGRRWGCCSICCWCLQMPVFAAMPVSATCSNHNLVSCLVDHGISNTAKCFLSESSHQFQQSDLPKLTVNRLQHWTSSCCRFA